jgi:uncharacterized protein (UPF0333 family)
MKIIINFQHNNFLFTILLFCLLTIKFSKAQISSSTIDRQYIDYYTFLFFNERSQNTPKGKILLPGTFPELNYDLKTNFISFETTFNLKYPNATTTLTFENGFHDEGMVLINGEFIDPNIIKGKEGYLRKIPNAILKEGENKITLLNIFHSPLWEFEGDLYLENGLEKVILNGYWDYTIHKNLETNFQRKPTQGLNVFEFLDVNFKSYLDSKVARDWSKTNFPVEIETLYNDKQLNGAFCFKKTVTFDKSPTEDFYFTVDKGIDDNDRLYVNGYLIGSTDCFSCERNYRIPYTYLKKQNEFTLFMVDKNGIGGIMSPVFLKSKTTSIDISNQWSYHKLLEMQMLITLKNAEEGNSFFGNSDFKFYDLEGGELNFDSLLVDKNNIMSLPFLLLLIVTLGAVVTIIYLLINRKNAKAKTEEVISPKNISEHLFIRADRADHKILIRDIISLEGKKDYVKLQLESKSYLVRKNLKTFLNQLPASKFIRISKSVAINLDRISKIEKNILFLSSGSYYVISKNYIKDINELFIK